MCNTPPVGSRYAKLAGRLIPRGPLSAWGYSEERINRIPTFAYEARPGTTIRDQGPLPPLDFRAAVKWRGDCRCAPARRTPVIGGTPLGKAIDQARARSSFFCARSSFHAARAIGVGLTGGRPFRSFELDTFGYSYAKATRELAPEKPAEKHL